MARLINSTAMTVDGVMEVGDWFVAEGDHDDASRSLIEGEVVMLTGRPTPSDAVRTDDDKNREETHR